MVNLRNSFYLNFYLLEFLKIADIHLEEEYQKTIVYNMNNKQIH